MLFCHWVRLLRVLCSIALLLSASSGLAQTKAQNLESFETVWKTVRDRHPDPKFNGLNWQAIHDQTRPRIAAAKDIDEVRDILRAMLAKLGASHYAIIPKDRYDEPKPAEAHPASAEPTPFAAPASAQAGSRTSPAAPEPSSSSKTVTFGNLPQMTVTFDSRTLPDGAGYIRFNEFLDPVSIMPKLDSAIKGFAHSPGIILDLRGNRGGIAMMAMGVAGFFIDKPGQKLGEMRMADSTLKFVVFPRPDVYKGPLAVLVDSGSASTAEILAQGLRDLGRARIFGTRTAAAALPSDIVRLPNGDGFQFAQASYTSDKGTVLEGNGVTPDVDVRQTEEAALAGHDLVIDAADNWIRSQH